MSVTTSDNRNRVETTYAGPVQVTAVGQVGPASLAVGSVISAPGKIAIGNAAGTPVADDVTDYVPFSVKDPRYGATGDGATDDTAAINAAIAAAGPNGTVLIPKGTYVIKTVTPGGVVLNLATTAGVSLVGEPGASIIKLDAASAATSIMVQSNGIDQMVKGITLDQNGLATAIGVQVGSSAARVKILDNTIKNGNGSGARGVYLRSPTGTIVRGNHVVGVRTAIETESTTTLDGLVVANNHLDGTGITEGIGMQLNSPSGSMATVSVTGNVVENFPRVSGSNGLGIALAQVVKATISGNVVRNCGHDGIHVEDDSTDVAITGNTVTGCGGEGITAQNNSSNPSRRISIVGNTVADCLGAVNTDGIGLTGTGTVLECVVAHNIVRNCGRSAVDCRGIAVLAKDTVVIGNVVSNTQGAATSGIFLGSGCTDVMVAHNRCYDDQGGPTQDYGLKVGAVQTRVRILDNDFNGNGTGAIDESALTTPTDYRKRGNIGADLEAVSADNGDAAKTLTVYTHEKVQRWNTALTAARAVTLSTTGAVNGDKWRIVREAGATGAFNLNVGTGPLKALATASTWCEVEYDGAAWRLTANGAL